MQAAPFVFRSWGGYWFGGMQAQRKKGGVDDGTYRPGEGTGLAGLERQRPNSKFNYI